jgi:hypothetical protein
LTGIMSSLSRGDQVLTPLSDYFTVDRKRVAKTFLRRSLSCWWSTGDNLRLVFERSEINVRTPREPGDTDRARQVDFLRPISGQFAECDALDLHVIRRLDFNQR